jgi:hypothetical protein
VALVGASGCTILLGENKPFHEVAGTGGGASATASSGTTTSASTGAGTSTGGSTTASSGMSASSATGTTASTSTSASSGSGGSASVTVLADDLLGPEAIAVDTMNVYFTTNNPPSGPSKAGFVDKATQATGTPVAAVAFDGSFVYVADKGHAGTPDGRILKLAP